MHRPNRTPIERINDEVEAGIAKAFPRLLLEMELERHTRRGTRVGCDCNYCQTKATATVAVGQAARHVSWKTIPSSHPRDVRGYGSCGPKYHDEWLLKFNARDRVRRGYRETLFEIRNRCE